MPECPHFARIVRIATALGAACERAMVGTAGNDGCIITTYCESCDCVHVQVLHGGSVNDARALQALEASYAMLSRDIDNEKGEATNDEEEERSSSVRDLSTVRRN